jgi:hypothetical protein
MVASQDPPPPVRLFILRLWPEDLGNGGVEWRGRLQHVPGGEICYFRTWVELIDCLRATLARDNELPI